MLLAFGRLTSDEVISRPDIGRSSCREIASLIEDKTSDMVMPAREDTIDVFLRGGKW